MTKSMPLILAAMLTVGCAEMDPNVREDAARVALQEGRCDEVKTLVSSAARQGQPWAQYRLAAALIECNPSDPMAAIEWMRRVASYPVATAWERGQSGSMGPVGYFNARDPVARAAIFLTTFDQAKGQNKEAWMRLAKARTYFSASEALFEQLSLKMTAIEKNIPDAALDTWRTALSGT